MLKRRGIKHETLNAKFHEKESGIVAQAGRTGRGHDRDEHGRPRHGHQARRRLGRPGVGPAPQAGPEPGRGRQGDLRRGARRRRKPIVDEDHEQVVAAGGLHIIGTERHDSRRIDNQLRGRAGRQGDPGSSRFYLSLEDDLMKRFASDRVAGLMERMGLEDDVAIECRLVSKTIESAQSRVEGFNFDMRKRVVEFDDVINRQRETIYAERDKVLRNEDLAETIRTFLDDEVHAIVDQHLVGRRRPTTGAWRRSSPRSGRWASTARARPRTSSGTSAARDEILEHLLAIAEEKLEHREDELRQLAIADGRGARRARPSGRSSSGSSCSARSTPCGSST